MTHDFFSLYLFCYENITTILLCLLPLCLLSFFLSLRLSLSLSIYLFLFLSFYLTLSNLTLPVEVVGVTVELRGVAERLVAIVARPEKVPKKEIQIQK